MNLLAADYAQAWLDAQRRVKSYRFHREAPAEYRAALTWYVARSLDAADDFADAIAHGIHGLRELPEAWRV